MFIAANWGNLDVDWIKNEWRTIAGETDPRLRRFQELLRQQEEHSNQAGQATAGPPLPGGPVD